MESWRTSWRNGFARVLPASGLEALREAILADDQRLTQGSMTTPPPLNCVQDWPVEAADAIAFCGWQGEGLATVGEVEQFFARMAYEADQMLGEAAACRWFLNWFDDTPREEMLRELLPEVERALAAVPRCDLCNQPITDERPGGRSVAAGIETFAHADHSVRPF